ncbi:MAG: hypothetical protein ACOCQR_02945 [bacterium]
MVLTDIHGLLGSVFIYCLMIVPVLQALKFAAEWIRKTENKESINLKKMGVRHAKDTVKFSGIIAFFFGVPLALVKFVSVLSEKILLHL